MFTKAKKFQEKLWLLSKLFFSLLILMVNSLRIIFYRSIPYKENNLFLWIKANLFSEYSLCHSPVKRIIHWSCSINDHIFRNITIYSIWGRGGIHWINYLLWIIHLQLVNMQFPLFLGKHYNIWFSEGIKWSVNIICCHLSAEDYEEVYGPNLMLIPFK